MKRMSYLIKYSSTHIKLVLKFILPGRREFFLNSRSLESMNAQFNLNDLYFRKTSNTKFCTVYDCMYWTNILDKILEC